MKNCMLSMLVAVVVVILLIAIWISWNGSSAPSWMQLKRIKSLRGEKFSTFSGPTNPIINVHAAKPEFDPRYNLLAPYGCNRGDFSHKALAAEAARRGIVQGPYGDFGGRATACSPVCGPAPCRATERLTGAGPAVGAPGAVCGNLCPTGGWYASASGGETGSPWLGRAPAPGNESFKPARPPSVPRADGGMAHSPFASAPPGAYAARSDLRSLDWPENRTPAFTQLMDGSLARMQQHSEQPNHLTGVGQGIRGDPRYDPAEWVCGCAQVDAQGRPIPNSQPVFVDHRPAPGTHAGSQIYSDGLATDQFRW